jgi:ribosomal protein S27AE
MNKKEKKILADALSNLNDEQRKDYDECIKRGYKDEFCPKCGSLFLANIHFIRCSANDCPMSNGKSLLDMMSEIIKKEGDEAIPQ